MKKGMKTIGTLVMMLGIMACALACDKTGPSGGGDNGGGDNGGNGGNGGNGNGGTSTEAFSVKITGAIDHNTHTPNQSGTVEFNRFPATVDEFKQARDVIGGEPHGAVALQIMAFEMYRRDRKKGETCIRLNNVATNANESVRRLKDLFSSDQNYARPYQMAAFLKGATPRNGYKPDKPYTIEVRVNNGIDYQPSSIYDAKVIYLQVLTAGTDGGARNIDVLKTRKPGTPGENGKFFIVFNSPGLDTQVKKIESDASFNGLD